MLTALYKRRKYLLLTAVISGLLVGFPYKLQAQAVLLQEVKISDQAKAHLTQKPFIIQHGTRTWKPSSTEIKKWFKIRTVNGEHYLQLRPAAIYDYLNRYISPQVNDTGEKSRFIRNAQGKIELVKGGRKGKIVDGVKTSLAIRQALVSSKNNVTVSMKEYRPSIFSVEDFAKLQFPHLLTRSHTNFAGSPSNRVHNIKVATTRYHGLVLLPQEEFSFNDYLGNVDAANGYLPELVIKDNVTTPEYGGGICQVSTTAFRAAMESGLHITSRRNHSYPVRYYGTPGYDATVYAPSTDFRFRNDTAHPILLKTSVQGTKVIFEIWGTNDGRQVTVNGPFVTERKPDGSLTAAVAQIIKKGGKVIREQNFVSRYQSPDKFPTVRDANGG